MPWVFDAASDIGGRNEQQDRMAVLHTVDGSTHLLVVADGAGGHSNGALAAQTVVETVQDCFSQGVTGEPLGFVEDVCLSAHEAVTGLVSEGGRPPASTCVLLLLRDRDAYWGHVGDSRLYHLRGEQVLFETADHSLARLCAGPSGDDDNSSRELPPNNTLYMCLGARRDILPEVNASLVAPGDSFLLCSDGFWNHVQVEEVAGSLSGKNGSAQSAREWVRQARSRGGDGADNISLLFARWRSDYPGRLIGRARDLLERFGRSLPGRG